MPSGKRDDKSYHVSDEHRLAMLNIFVAEINDSIHLAEQDFSSSITETDELCRNDKKSRVIIDDYFIQNWEGEMITKDVDRYCREKYGDDIVHIFGTDTVASMPDWDSEQYAAKVVKKLFVPRNIKKNKLEKVME
jgi:nicotinic acid mononucleotide adenylyltransferase